MKSIILLFIGIFFLTKGFSQININNPFEDLSFTKNEGQWLKEEKETNRKILFGASIQGKLVFITNKGLVYKYLDFYNEKEGFFEKYFKRKGYKEKNESEEDEDVEFYKKGKLIPKYSYVNYINANDINEILTENKTGSYTCYSNPNNLNNTIKAFAFKKIIIKNIYNNIDLEYIIKENGGFEYNFILKPFANPNSIKINYNGFESISLTDKNELSCKIDSNKTLIETKPIAFEKNTSTKIECNWVINKNTIQFNLPNYNSSKEVIIDPVVFNPALTAYNRVYDIAKDNAGNVFVFGGQCPYVLKKFSSTGVLLWSFDWSTQPTPPTLYGDFAVDQNDNVIMVQGYPAGRIIKLDPTGATIYNIILAGSAGATELWRVGFNCNYSALRISGYIQNGGYKQMVNMDPLTGAVIGVSTAASDESRALFIDPSGEIYSLTPSQGGVSNPATNYFTKFDVLLNSVYRINSGYNTNEGSGIYHSVTYHPTLFYSNMNAITADNNNVYTYEGQTLFKRRQSNGAAVASIVIPGGSPLANSGIVIDPCFNLFVGTQTGVVRLDTNLNIISTLATPAQVYDLCLYNSHILATGNGFVNELDFGTNCKLTVTTSTVANTRCVAPYNGIAAVTSVTNGVAPYTYLWNTGATTTSITALAPGKYWVTIKDSYCGNPKQSVDTVFITNNLTIPNASFTANNACFGSTTTFTNLSTPIAPSSFSITTWNWDFTNDGVIDNVTQNPSFVFTSSGTYTTSLFVTATNACTATITGTIAVNPNPTVTVNSSTICLSQQTATLIANGATSYTWSPGLSSTVGTSVTGTPAVTQNYTVTGSDLNGCINTNTLSVLVNSLPIVSSNNSTICLGQQTATLTASGANSYTWSAGLSSTSGTVVTGTPSSTQNYTLTGTDLNGCFNNYTAAITVNALPVLSVNNSTICVGLQTATLNASGASTYTWSAGLSASTGATVTGTPLTTQNYTLTGTDLNGCIGTTTTSILVNALPTITVNSSTICLGQQTAILVAGGALTYSWTAGLNSTTGSTVTGNPIATQNYTVSGTDLNGCINSSTLTVSVIPIPTVTVNSATICSSSNALLTASGASTYTWFPGSSLTSTTGVNVNANPILTTTYTLLGTSVSGCTNTATSIVNVISTPTINANALPTNICVGQTATLTASGAMTYTWSPGAMIGGTATVSPISPTTYSVTGTNTDGTLLCTSSQTVTLLITPQTTITISKNDSICLGGSKSITASGGNTYTWTPNSGISNPHSAITTASPSLTTIYTLTAIQSGLCANSSTIEIVVNPLPYVYAGVDTTINIDESYVLNGTGDVDVGFLSPNQTPLICNFCPIVEVAPKETTCYTLKGTNGHGCSSYDDICIKVTTDWNVYIPNAFTPNGDLDNEVFLPVGYGIESIDLMIFDRWGDQIFRSSKNSIGWNGKKQDVWCEQGVYVYKVEIKTMSGINVIKTGHVTLLSKLK